MSPSMLLPLAKQQYNRLVEKVLSGFIVVLCVCVCVVLFPGLFFSQTLSLYPCPASASLAPLCCQYLPQPVSSFPVSLPHSHLSISACISFPPQFSFYWSAVFSAVSVCLLVSSLLICMIYLLLNLPAVPSSPAALSVCDRKIRVRGTRG